MQTVIHKGVAAPMPERFREDMSKLYGDEIHRCIEAFNAPASWADAIGT